MKFIQALKKETLLLLRDPASLAILFLLPGVMVFLVAYIQDMAFEKFTDIKMPLLVVDEDQDSLGTKIVREFKAAHIFDIITEIDKKPLTAQVTREKVASGEYELAIIIPQGASQKIRNQANQILDQAFNASDTTADEDSTLHVSLVYDPALMPSFRASVNANLDKYITQIQSEVLVDAFVSRLQKQIPGIQPISLKNTAGLAIQ